MQQRASFEPIKTSHPDLFGVKVSGHLGTQQRGAVEGLVRRCKELGKTRVVFDLSELESMGGSVANVLGQFAAELSESGHPPWFVGASDVVQSFMTGRFDRIEPSFADEFDQAVAALAEDPVAQPVATAVAEPPKPEAAAVRNDESALRRVIDAPSQPSVEESRGDSDSLLEVLEAVAAEESVETKAPDDSGPSRKAHLTLTDAEPQLRELASLRKAKPVLEGLLHGANLAAHCHLFCLDGDRVVEVDAEGSPQSMWLPASGIIGAVLMRRASPVDLIDLCDQDLEVQETEVLATLNCQVVVPVFVDAQLAGLFFVRKALAGEEYYPSEELALDLLSRQVGLSLSQGQQRVADGPSESEKELKLQARRQRSALRLSRELHGLADSEQLVSRLLISLIGEMGIAGAVYLEPDGHRLQSKHAYNLEAEDLPALTVPNMQELMAIDEPVHPEEIPDEVGGLVTASLAAAGIDLLVPFRGREKATGLIGMAARRSKESGKFDADYLSTTVFQAALAAEHLRAVRLVELQTLRVAKSLITLVEKKIGQGSMVPVELVTHYVARVAQQLNYEKDHLRDLLYGSVLRDVGMIEISDLVLKSPRQLTPEEWKLVQRHPISGAEVLRQMHFSDVTCDVVLHHHERFNGDGYPHGLRGAAIPQGARIVAVVESYVAMLRETPYRPALAKDEALEVLCENWEMRYDPAVISTFVQVLRNENLEEQELDIEALLLS